MTNPFSTLDPTPPTTTPVPQRPAPTTPVPANPFSVTDPKGKRSWGDTLSEFATNIVKGADDLDAYLSRLSTGDKKAIDEGLEFGERAGKSLLGLTQSPFYEL